MTAGDPRPSREGDLLPAAVREMILGCVRPLAPGRVPLREAVGLILAEAVVAPFDLPRSANAAMDGYAVRSADAAPADTVRLMVVGHVPAGHPAIRPLGPSEAMAIATGGIMPEGSDAVVPLEAATVEGDCISLRGPVPAGQHVRAAGEDIVGGEIALDAGVELRASQLAALAAFGLRHAPAYPRARVAVIPTGDEIVSAAAGLHPGQSYDAVSVALSALIEELGARARVMAVSPDEPSALRQALLDAAGRADAVVTVGGVAMGERDVMAAMGDPSRVGPPSGEPIGRIEMRSLRVALRPGRPFAFGSAAGVPVFGLPGNPAAALAAFEELVRPGVLALMGKAPALRPSVTALLAEPFSQLPGRLHLVRAEVWRRGGELLVRPAGRQGAGMIHSLARANAWALIPAEASDLPAGTPVEVRLLSDPR